MKRISFLSFAVCILIAASCGSSKESAKDNGSDANAATAEVTATSPASVSTAAQPATAQTTQVMMSEENSASQKQEAEKYRLIVSFISIGEGTDMKAKEIMDRIISSWESRTSKKFEMEPVPWGREGEVDFCFNLKELPPPDQAKLARDLREALKDHPLVQFYEYQACLHKR